MVRVSATAQKALRFNQLGREFGQIDLIATGWLVPVEAFYPIQSALSKRGFSGYENLEGTTLLKDRFSQRIESINVLNRL